MTKFHNPILAGFHPDPSICRVGSDYYIVTSTMEYFPGLPIFHSRDLVHWRQIGYCLTRNNQLQLGNAVSSQGVFAPTIRHHNGRYYVTTTNVSEGGNFIVWTSDPSGEWSDPIWIDQAGIDPSLFWDDDETLYYTTTDSKGILQSTIDIETGKFLIEPKWIWGGTGGRYPEAPHLYKINAMYYLMMAEGGTEFGHFETIARGHSPWGPFEACPNNPILSHRNRSDCQIQATGHADLVETQDGSWWAVCLGVRAVGFYPQVHHIGRETFLAPVHWDADGWPVIGNSGTIDLDMAAPSLPAHPWPLDPSRDEFDSPTLRMPWNFRGNPSPDSWSLANRPSWLELRCGAGDLNAIMPQSFVGRRQQHFNCRVETHVDFVPEQPGEEAGLTAYMNENHHYEIFITCSEITNERQVAVRRRIGDLMSIVASVAVPDGNVTLSIRATPEQYTFAYSTPGSLETKLADAATRYLSTEIAGGFSGVYLALYAAAQGEMSESFAYFDWFDYQAE